MTVGSIQKAMLDQLYRENHRSVLAYCLRRTDRASAYDATAEVFVVAVRRAEEVPKGEAALPWLYGTAFKVLSNQRRSANRARRLIKRVSATTANSISGPDVVVVRKNEYEEVAEALAQLSTLDREIILLATWESLTAMLDCLETNQLSLSIAPSLITTSSMSATSRSCRPLTASCIIVRTRMKRRLMVFSKGISAGSRRSLTTMESISSSIISGPIVVRVNLPMVSLAKGGIRDFEVISRME